MEKMKKCAKARAAELLEIAKDEIYSHESLVEYAKKAKAEGKAEALKDLPRWKKCDPNSIYNTKFNFIVNGVGRYIVLDGYMINVDRLKKLPGFKEDESHE